MPQAVSNRAKLSVIREVTPGTTPATPKFQPVRTLSASLAAKPKTKRSGEIVSDRMLADEAIVGLDQDGTIATELSYAGEGSAQDIMLESAFWAASVNTPEADNSNAGVGTIGSVIAATDIPVTGGGTWQPGMLVRAMGFLTPANNKIVSALAASSATTIKTAGFALETTPLTARVKNIGVQSLAAADITAVTAGGNALVSTATNWTLMPGLVVGGWCLNGTNGARPIVNGVVGVTDVYSFATLANNGLCRISAITPTRLSFDIVPVGWAADAGAAKTIRVFYGDYLRNGVTPLAASIEQQHADQSPPGYQLFKGMFCDSAKFGLTSQDIMTLEFAWKGLNTVIGTTRSAGATDGTLPSTDVMNTSSNVLMLSENGVPITGAPGNYALSFDVSLNNDLRALPAVSQLGYIGINPGQAIPTGTAKFYFANTDILAKAILGTATSLNFAAQDAAGNLAIIDLPKVKFESAQAPVGSLNQDLSVDVGFVALRFTPAVGAAYAIQFQRMELAGTNA